MYPSAASKLFSNQQNVQNGGEFTWDSPPLEQVKGVEPSYRPWEGRVLPMNYTCIKLYLLIIAKPGPKCKHFFSGGFDFFLPGGTGEGGREKISVTRKK